MAATTRMSKNFIFEDTDEQGETRRHQRVGKMTRINESRRAYLWVRARFSARMCARTLYALVCALSLYALRNKLNAGVESLRALA